MLLPPRSQVFSSNSPGTLELITPDHLNCSKKSIWQNLYPFLTKTTTTLNKLGIEGNFPKATKAIYENSVNLTLSGGRLKAFPRRSIFSGQCSLLYHFKILQATLCFILFFAEKSTCMLCNPHRGRNKWETCPNCALSPACPGLASCPGRGFRSSSRTVRTLWELHFFYLWLTITSLRSL